MRINSERAQLDGYMILKRAMDVCIAGFAWLMLSPLFYFIILMIKITSPGSAFYRWKVVGEGGRYFTSFKFRSMYSNADELKRELLHLNEMTGPVFKISKDPRVTPLGRVLRKFSIDELPQLWSIMKGDMSLVGPRPPLQAEYELFSNWQKKKLAVKPGATCLWQTNGRNDISDFDEWVRLDLEYIEHRSLGLDVKILMDTVRTLLIGTGK